MNKSTLTLLLLAIVAAVGGFILGRAIWLPDHAMDQQLLVSQLDQTDGESILNQPQPGFRHSNTDGQWVSAADFNGQVLLINFWATWCAPCREEMPLLQRLQDQHGARGLQVVGIALDDVQQAREFATALDIRFPILVGSQDVMATNRIYGNRSGALPYSVLVDRLGIIRWRHLGPVEKTTLLSTIGAAL